MNCPGVAERFSSIAGVRSISSVCSIITTASAPRGTTPPVAMVVAVPGNTSISAGADCEAVDIGAVERRRVDRRGEIVRQHAAERGCERYVFGGQGAKIE